jgi:hypothetical protein
MDAKVDLPLLGAGPIAEGVLGKDTPANRRKIYYWHSQGVIPTFLWAKQLALFPEDLPTRIDELKAESREAQLRRREQLRAKAEAEVRRVRTRRGRARATSSIGK